MLRRTLAAGALALSALGLAAAPARAQQPTEIQFWHGLTQPNGGLLEQIATDFNNSQNRYRVVASFRGSYPETMSGAIAAFRERRRRHIDEMFEWHAMMAAGRAIKPVLEIAGESNTQINFDDTCRRCAAYYSLRDGG
jgi:sn-glycerol 3-phosphate transport system substrate-binding protein